MRRNTFCSDRTENGTVCRAFVLRRRMGRFAYTFIFNGLPPIATLFGRVQHH